MKRSRGYAPLDYTLTGAAQLETMLRHCRDAGPGHAVVLDLDGCLFDTRPRQVHIFREIASRDGLTPLYRVEAKHFRDWSLKATMRRAGLDEEWIAAHHDAIRAFWEERFFTSRYVEYDHAMPGAAAFVREIRAAGLHIVYLTGRDETMRPGTEESLARSGFPTGHGATLLVKPDAHIEDTAFKDSALEHVARLGTVVLYLDNEPSNVNMFRLRHPEAMVVFVETDHSFRPVEPDPSIPWIRSFLRAPV